MTRSSSQTTPASVNAGPRRWAILSTLLGCGLLGVYAVRPDSLAAVTVFPPWIWLFPAAILLWGARRANAMNRWLAVLLWLAYFVATCDSPQTLLRGAKERIFGRPATAIRGGLRVVTLNCGGAGVQADELLSVAPDVVLLQEIPSRDQLASLAQELFGTENSWAANSDTAVLMRGRARQLDLSPLPGDFATAVIAQSLAGGEAVLVSLRLETYPVRLDFWSPDFWRSYAAVRRRQRSQMSALTAALSAHVKDRSALIGGDFNAPPGDPIFDALRPGRRDVFPAAGIGWGGTIVNDYPAVRIDQIWAGGSLLPQRAWAARTRSSDHRMVVCDFAVVP